MPRGSQFQTRRCLGKYSSWFRRLYGPKRFRWEARVLDKFFDAYPNHFRLIRFTTEEIDDWAIERRKHVSAASVSIELSCISRFWRWVQENIGYELPNPVQRVRKRAESLVVKRVTNKKTLSLPELRVIVPELPSVRLQEYIYRLILGLPIDPEKGPEKFFQTFRRATNRLHMDYSLYDLRRSIPTLRVAILQDLGLQVGYSLMLEPKSYRRAFRNIQVPALNIGSPVIHHDDNSPAQT